jgi:cyanophycinase-like exopeptidase
MANQVGFPPNMSSSTNSQISELISKRELFRQNGDFAGADLIRLLLESWGYLVQDTKNGTKIIDPNTSLSPAKPFIVIFGSGEISPTGRRIHEEIFRQIGKDPIKIALINTPAGFQPNVDQVYQEIANFFHQSLANFHPQIKIIEANTKEDANNPKLIEPIHQADYIFTGPGSPTYAVIHLKDTLLLQAITDRVKAGASLCLASAASIAFSQYALPVYEIYKVGDSLHWLPGLNFYTQFYQDLTIIPHFNNQEGGNKTDTSYCFMGKDRFGKLKKLLPEKENILGLDEHTAAIIDLTTKKIYVQGKGNLHLISPNSI